MEAGADPSREADQRGYLALHVAVAAGRVHAVDHLLDHAEFGLGVESATFRAAGCAAMTPLACAAVTGQVRGVRAM